MKDKVWIMAIVVGVLILLMALLGLIGTTAGVLIGVAFLLAGFIVRRIQTRKAGGVPPS
ncbi:MAG TPA: hypothetical protein VM737_05725 [Gemmatimonadota bacterium]|nr:hypothetical protein [Gemmatimonadota bacterium]